MIWLSVRSKWDISPSEGHFGVKTIMATILKGRSKPKCSKLATSKGPSEWRISKGTNDGHFGRKKHRGSKETPRATRWNSGQTEKQSSQPPSPSILLANVQSLENKMDDLRARTSFQRDIRDCNILCLSETWLTPSVPGHRCNTVW